jgi:hypothetical protein
MQLATGTVIDGKVVLEGATLPEGVVVTVLARDSKESFDLPPELEAELAAAIAEAGRGETVSPKNFSNGSAASPELSVLAVASALSRPHPLSRLRLLPRDRRQADVLRSGMRVADVALRSEAVISNRSR